MTKVNKEKMRAVGVTPYMDGDKLMYDIAYKPCKEIALNMLKDLIYKLKADKNIGSNIDDDTVGRWEYMIYNTPKDAYDWLITYGSYINEDDKDLVKLYNDTLDAINDCLI